MCEQWSQIPGYDPRVLVSDLGRVKGKTGIILKQDQQKNGYCYVNLFKNGKYRGTSVHRLVLLAFRPRADADSLQVDHKNERKTDNRLGNLEWVTQSENMKRRKACPRKRQNGERNYRSRWTEADVLRIRALCEQGMLHRQISESTGVPIKTVQKICNRETWKHI